MAESTAATAPVLTGRFQPAFTVACEVHAAQLRKATRIPYHRRPARHRVGAVGPLHPGRSAAQLWYYQSLASCYQGRIPAALSNELNLTIRQMQSLAA
jgi:hypothetical protein